MGMYNLLTFRTYVRYTIEVFLLLLLAGISEVERFKFDTTMKLRSFILAGCVVAYCVCFIIFTLIHWIVYSGTEDLDDSKFRDLYSGLKPKRFARLFNLMFTTRRLLFCVLLVVFFDLDKFIKICALTGMQLIY